MTEYYHWRDVCTSNVFQGPHKRPCIHCPCDLPAKTGQHGSWLTSAVNLAWCLGSWKTTSREKATFTSNSSHAGLV